MGTSWLVIPGAALMLALCWWSYRARTHTLSGCALVLGCWCLAFLGGSWLWGAVVIVYFAGTIFWYRYGMETKAVPLGRLLGYSRVTWKLVASKLGWAMVLSVIAWLAKPGLALTSAFTGVLAFACADTWATEAGALSRPVPRHLINGRPASAGTPGAITLMGLLASAGGAWLSGFTALACYYMMGLLEPITWYSDALFWLPVAAALGGLAGTFIDSLLGGTAQGMYYCDHCHKPSESSLHYCGAAARQVSGWRWLSNEGVNLVASLASAAMTSSIVLLAHLAL